MYGHRAVVVTTCHLDSEIVEDGKKEMWERGEEKEEIQELRELGDGEGHIGVSGNVGDEVAYSARVCILKFTNEL